MQAVILAGGEGTRLRPLTDYVPKPLIPLNNVPLLEWQIRYLKKFGIKNIIICTGYKTSQIEEYLSHKKNFGCKIICSAEKTPLGTGGAIKKVSRLIKGRTFLLLNGDVITTINLRKLLKKSNTISLIELRTRFGTVGLSGEKIISFKEKKPVANVWMNAGIYHLERNILADLPSKGTIEEITFRNYAKKDKLSAVKFKDAFWFSIDSHKDLEECTHSMKAKKYEKFVSKQ